MSSTFGTALRLTIFGQSHGPAVGLVADGLPAGMVIDMDGLRKMMRRRAPGQSALSTARREPDEPEFLSGVLEGKTTGQPLCIVLRNRDAHSGDYGAAMDVPRPSHADYTGHVRYKGHEDWRGGGSFSGRLTGPLVACGALCRQYLADQGVRIAVHISRLGGIVDEPFDPCQRDGDYAFLQDMPLPVLRAERAAEMEAAILAARQAGDSVGGVLECRIDGLPAGLGAPFFDSAESVLSQLLFSVPAVKGVEFGSGFALAGLRGSEANDPLRIQDGQIVTATNHAGGINGGITNGMPLIFRCALRPTPSIALPQESVSLSRMEAATLQVRGRHDPCILPRAVPVIEAVAAIAVLDLWKERAACL